MICNLYINFLSYYFLIISLFFYTITNVLSFEQYKVFCFLLQAFKNSSMNIPFLLKATYFVSTTDASIFHDGVMPNMDILLYMKTNLQNGRHSCVELSIQQTCTAVVIFDPFFHCFFISSITVMSAYPTKLLVCFKSSTTCLLHIKMSYSFRTNKSNVVSFFLFFLFNM